MASERKSDFGYFACKKEAKLSASGVPGEVLGSGEEDLRCRSLLTVCQRRLGLSEAEDTRLEKYVSRCFQRGEGWTEMDGGWQKTMGSMETGAWRVC